MIRECGNGGLSRQLYLSQKKSIKKAIMRNTRDVK